MTEQPDPERPAPWDAAVTPLDGIVVGHDGSRCADAALDWALADAVRREEPVHVVRTWMLASALDDVPGPPGTVPSLQECADVTLALLTADVDRRCAARRAAGAADVTVTSHAVHGPAGPTLVGLAAGATLLVVGHRGRGQLADLLLGSVAEHVLRHARCTVVVVRQAPQTGALR